VKNALKALRACLVVLATLLLGVASAVAGPLPNGERKVSITAREQPIGAFLQNLFAAVDVPANLSPNLAGNVNGTFAGPADRVLRDVSRVYNLVSYYDGAVMHVVPANELVTRNFAVGASASSRLLRDVNDMRLTDSRNLVRTVGEGSLVAVGTRRFVEQVDELLRGAQAAPTPGGVPAGTMDFRVFYLRYAWAQDTTMNLGGRQIVVPGVASILRSLVGAASTSPIASDTLRPPTLPHLRGQGLKSYKTASPAKDEPAAARTGAVDSLVQALGVAAQADASAAQPSAVVDPRQVRIEADPRLNAIIVRDLAERLPRYEQLIAALDVEPQSLEIEATIIDVNTDRMRELGVNWRWNNAGYGAAYSGSVPTTGAGGIVSAVLGSAGQFFARIRALQAEGAARVVSSPQVVTLSNVEAVFDNSSTFYVRVAGKDEVDLFNVSAGTSLRVTPHVFREAESTRIKLLVNVEDGNVTNRQVDQIPVVERSTINTQALIVEGESLLIGGMTRESTSQNVDKVPGLGDVPVIGNAFKNKTSASSRVERMFLITPRLAGSRAAVPAPARATTTTAAAPVAAPAAAAAPGPAPVPAPAPAPAPVALAAPAPVAAPAPAPVPARVARESTVLDLDAMPAGRPAPIPAARPNPPPAVTRVVAPGRIAER
jgi:type III secretion protein C